MRQVKQYVPVQPYAADGAPRPRFGIRSESMTAGSRPVHRYDYFEVLFFTSEEASAQRIALRKYVTRRGSIFFISPMMPHQVRFDANASCFRPVLRPRIPPARRHELLCGDRPGAARPRAGARALRIPAGPRLRAPAEHGVVDPGHVPVHAARARAPRSSRDTARSPPKSTERLAPFRFATSPGLC